MGKDSALSGRSVQERTRVGVPKLPDVVPQPWSPTEARMSSGLDTELSFFTRLCSLPAGWGPSVRRKSGISENKNSVLSLTSFSMTALGLQG